MQAEIDFLRGIEKVLNLLQFGWTEIRRYVVQCAAREFAEQLQRRVSGEEQHQANQENRDDIKHHRLRISFTVRVYCFSSVTTASGVRAGAVASSCAFGTGHKKVRSQIATPIVYVIGTTNRNMGSNFVPNSERTMKATRLPAADTPKPSAMPKVYCFQGTRKNCTSTRKRKKIPTCRIPAVISK